MSGLQGLRLAVAGAGALGLGVAATAARQGARVTVFEPRALGDNASGLAAGMLSPVLEAALEDDADSGRSDLFTRAYAAWPDFADKAGVAPPAALSAGALYVGAPTKLDGLARRLETLGREVCRLDGAQARRRQPLYAGASDALWIEADGRLDPGHVLRGLRTAFRAAEGLWRDEALTPSTDLGGFDAVVLAAGFETTAWAEAAPELACLAPIKGHILRYPGVEAAGPTLRGPGGYLAPQAGAVVFGATMEAGRSDADVDPALAAELHARASALAPGLAALVPQARAGVRATTPDGAPLVGRSAGGAVLATGARRNGWLLAPLVVEAALAAVVGEPPDPAFDPARFG